MSPRVRDLEPFEREWLATAGGDVRTWRASRAACPPLALLRAARADALPGDARDAVARHVTACRSCAVLQADLAAIPPESEISAADAERILREVRRKMRAESPAAGWLAGWWSWRAALAATALVAAAAAVAWQWPHRMAVPPEPALQTAGRPPVQGVPSGPQQVEPQPPVAAAAKMPDAFKIDKPEVRLTLATLAWRGADSQGADYLQDLSPGLDAFRDDRYADAATLFASVAAKYPAGVEAQFYLGVSRLLTGDHDGAAAALAAAADLDAEAFADDARWYLGLAHARAGRAAEAGALLRPLCRADGPYRDRSCAALKALVPVP